METHKNVVQRTITDDLPLLLDVLPPRMVNPIMIDGQPHLLEIVMDLGRQPQARYVGRVVTLSQEEVTDVDLEYVVSRIGDFGQDNRAGIERTLHRISCLRNRRGRIVGLTCRVGRAVYGTVQIIDDLVRSGRSILLLGRPGVGKTTMLREVARVLADDLGKRVVIVDTSNEIAGDGDIPHPAIGGARRLQVPTPAQQHAVMIEAVENHMPEVIVIDEIGTELEAIAARTIAERGVQLVGTAHGNELENLIINPTLSDLIGGIQSVTLGDEEARRRGTQKSILERKAPPTFEVVVEIQSWDRVAIHEDVAETVDASLRGFLVQPAIRELDAEGEIRTTTAPAIERGARLDARPPRTGRPRSARGEQSWADDGVALPTPAQPSPQVNGAMRRIYPFGVSRSRLGQAIRETNSAATIAEDMDEADALVTLRSYYRRKPQQLRDAESRGLPIYVLKNNTIAQMEQSLLSMRHGTTADPVNMALQEAEEAAGQVMTLEVPIELSPQNAYVRRLQHEVAQRYNIVSRSRGREPFRRVQFYPGEAPHEYA